MYIFNSRIRYSECDGDCRLTVPALVNYFQDVSTFQSEDLGVGFAYLEPKDMVWVLAAWQIEIKRLPQIGEEVEVGTLPYEFKGFMGLRNFCMRTKEGEMLAVANSQWTLLNTKTFKPERPTEEMLAAYVLEPKMEMNYTVRKVSMPQEMEQMESFEVVKSHLDSNNHVNNGQYIAMAAAYVPEDFATGSLRAEYKMQAHLGDVMVPHVGKTDTGVTVSLRSPEGSVYCNVEFAV